MQMRSLAAAGLAISLSYGLAVSAADVPNTLSGQETKDGWKLLFDGKTTAGWHGLNKTEFPARGWEVKDGALSVLSKTESPERGGDIVTDGLYTNFELRLEFRLTPAANSGIKYRVDPEFCRVKKSAVATEFQILDDALHPDAKLGRDGNRTAGALYDILPPVADKPMKPIGEWNEIRLVANGKRVEHWLNGKKVVEYEQGSPALKDALQKSKFKNMPEFATWPAGHILLQDHTDHVSYRNIKIKVLP